jgi:hypothetical protein
VAHEIPAECVGQAKELAGIANNPAIIADWPLSAAQAAAIAQLIGKPIDPPRYEYTLERRRGNLVELRILLDREQRRLGRYGRLAITGPPVLVMPEAVDPDTNWSGLLARLIADPETALE